MIVVMNPINEIIVLARPERIMNESYTGFCPLHKEPNPTLSFKDDGNKVVMFCHSCFHRRTVDGAKPIEIQIMEDWGLTEDNLYVSREMNPAEAEIILCRANLTRLTLKAQHFHHLELTDEVRSKYKSLVSEKMVWHERLEKAFQM